MAEQELIELIRCARGGCNHSAQRLYDDYHSHVTRAVRRHLAKELRARIDSTDVAQVVWASFLARNRFRMPPHLRSS